MRTRSCLIGKETDTRVHSQFRCRDDPTEMQLFQKCSLCVGALDVFSVERENAIKMLLRYGVCMLVHDGEELHESGCVWRHPALHDGVLEKENCSDGVVCVRGC